MITKAGWDKYKGIVNQVHNTYNQDILTWVRGLKTVEQFQEETEPSGDTVDLRVLLGFNYFRTWPLTERDQAGELDNENMIVLINKKYLGDLGYLTPKGYFNFSPGADFFIHRGLKYKSEGDTFVSQASDDPLFIQLILRREETLTGDKPFDAKTSQAAILEAEEDILQIIDTDDLQQLQET